MNKVFLLIVASLLMATVGVTAQDGVSYTTLPYSTVVPVNGTESFKSLTTENNLVEVFGYDVVAHDCKFNATAGKCYKFTVTFTTVEIFYSNAIVYLLNNVLTGDTESDLLQEISKYGNCESQITLKGTYIATESKTVKLLIGSCDIVPVDYLIKIEEVTTPPSYTGISYNNISFNTPVNSTLNATNAMIGPNFKYENGKGYIFTAKANKSYKITCTYSSEEVITFNSGFYLLTGGAWTGEYDILSDAFNYSDWEWSTATTVTHRYNASEEHDVRILLADRELNNLTYSLKIEEIDVPLYSEIDFPALTVNSVVNSTLTPDNTILSPSNYFTNGKGYSFNATAGKHYQITCNFFSPSSIYSVGFYMLKALSGNESGDVIDLSRRSANYYGNVTEYYTYTATSAGNVYMLLFSDDFETDLLYSIQVKEVSSPVVSLTLKQLLDNVKPANVITYSNNLSFTANGVADSFVKGLEWSPEQEYYAAAYKITLAAGNHIKIHSSKENDSFLYLYASDGMGGYTCIDYNDDDYDYFGGDSFLEYTATAANTYYIVVSDFQRGKSGFYFLTVWNTEEQPDNSYPEGIEISTIKPSANSISVNVGADETEIRIALMRLILTGTTAGGSVEIANNAFAWYIGSSDDGTTTIAYFTPFDAPAGYFFDYSVWETPMSVIVKYDGAGGINSVQGNNSAVVYTSNRNIIVRDAETGSRLLVTDMTGKVIANTVVNSSETNIPVKNSGVYVVCIGEKRVKAIVK